MKEKGLFRTSVFGGFKREDVLNYIDEQFNIAKESSDSLTKEIETLKVKYDYLLEEKNKLDAEKDSFNQMLEAERSKYSELEAEKKQLEQDKAALETEINRLKNQMEARTNELNEIISANMENSQKTGELLDKIEQLEENNKQLNSELVKIRNTTNTRFSEEAIEMDMLMKENQRLKLRVDELEPLVRKISAYEIHISQQADEIRRLRFSNIELESENKHLREQIISTEKDDEIEKLKFKLLELEPKAKIFDDLGVLLGNIIFMCKQDMKIDENNLKKIEEIYANNIMNNEN